MFLLNVWCSSALNLATGAGFFILPPINPYHMIRDFSFTWNGRRWNGYFNTLENNTLIAHFEDALIRQTIGQTLSYSKSETGAIAFATDARVAAAHTGIYEAILKGVETGLGKRLHQYLN